MKTITGTLVLILIFLSSGANGSNYQRLERRRWIKITKCKASVNQDGFPCTAAYDGIVDIKKNNGWAYNGQLPANVYFTLVKDSAVNRVGIKFMHKDNLYRAKKFQIQLRKDRKWIEPKVWVGGAAEATVNGSVVELKAKISEVDVAFERVTDVYGVNIIVLDSFETNKNSIFSEVFVANVAEKNCTTVGGLQRNKQCIFPFVNPFSKSVHYSCTTDQGLPPWCATRVNNNAVMPAFNFLGFCDESCQVEEESTCYTSNSVREQPAFTSNNMERRSCIFPFNYKGKWYNECATEIEGWSWNMCATSVNKWGTLVDYGICGPECPNSPLASRCIEAYGWGGKGSRCVFPAIDKGKYYAGCIKNFCPTSVGKDAKVIGGQWGHCGKPGSCNKDECITVGGARSGQACKFPFKNPWTNEMHYACTTAKLEEEEGSNHQYASAPWCAVDTDAADTMVDNNWGFCSKKCPVEKGNNCYVVDAGTQMKDMSRCILPFVYQGIKYKECTYVKGRLKCPIKIDNNGIAVERDMRPCGNSPSCFNSTTIAGHPITVGFVDVGSYTNSGSKELEIAFSFETGVEDSTESNWNVEASVTAGFSAFGAELEASVTAGGGGGSASASSSHQSHSLTYKCPPNTKVVLSQQVMKSGRFESRTFRLILSELKLPASRNDEPTERFLTPDEIFGNIQTRNL